jgi:hypothetical protein
MRLLGDINPYSRALLGDVWTKADVSRATVGAVVEALVGESDDPEDEAAVLVLTLPLPPPPPPFPASFAEGAEENPRQLFITITEENGA